MKQFERFTSGLGVHVGPLESLPHADKHKFPRRFFPEGRWSRKGFLRTRWRIRNTPVDLVNIHLFHDASNLVSVESSIYCDFRRRALRYALDRLQEQEPRLPYFIFGDFNFRLDGRGVLKRLTKGLIPATIKSDVGRLTFFDERRRDLVLSIGAKEFFLRNLESVFGGDRWAQWRSLDVERSAAAGGGERRLCEQPLAFAPTYPFEEEPSSAGGGGGGYMRTRCPAWCDRVLYSVHAARAVIEDEDTSCLYGVVGADVCMGDHKPVFLRFGLLPDRCEVEVPLLPRFEDCDEDAEEKRPRVESPSYIDLMAANCNKYIELSPQRQQPSPRIVKLFKETTV